GVIGTVWVEGFRWGWRTTGPEALRSVGEVELIVSQTGTPLETAAGSCQVGAALVSNVDLTQPAAVPHVLQAHEEAGQGRLRGVRHMAARDEGLVGKFLGPPLPRHLLAEPTFRRGFAFLQEAGLSFDAWLYHHQLADLIDLADAFPDTPIVLNHVGGLIGV